MCLRSFLWAYCVVRKQTKDTCNINTPCILLLTRCYNYSIRVTDLPEGMFLAGGRKPGNPEEIHMDMGRTVVKQYTKH